MKKWILLFIGLGLWFWTPSNAGANTSLQQQIDETPINGELKLEGKKYEGNILITKPITIIGSKNTVIRGDGTGNVITVDTDNVTLENLTVEHGSLSRSSDEEFTGLRVWGNNHRFSHIKIYDVYHGVYLQRTTNTLLKDITVVGHGTGTLGSQGNGIQLVRSFDITIEDCNISKTRDGILFEYSDRIDVRNNLVQNTRYGLHYMYSNNNTFTNNRFIKNTGGAAIMYSHGITLEHNQFSFNQGSRSFGLIIQASNNNIIKNNEFYLNQRGIYFEQSRENQVIGNKFFQNDIGVELWSSSTNQVFKDNHFKQNIAHALSVGGHSENLWFENGKGNYWGTELAGLDLDQNKIGDSPLEYKSSIYKLVEKNELAYLFLKSPSIRIYEKINEVTNTNEIMFIDQYPLIERKTHSSFNWLFILLVVPLIFVSGRRFYKMRRRS